MSHDPKDNEGAGVSGLEQRNRVRFHLCLKGPRNKELYSNRLPPDSLSNKYTQTQTQSTADGVNSESPLENRNSNKVNGIIRT